MIFPHDAKPGSLPGDRSVSTIDSPTTGRPRLVYLDNLKVVLVIGVIVAHAAMTYGAAGTWIFEAEQYGGSTLTGTTTALLSAAIGFGVLFGMGLFLLVAGLVTPASLARKGPRRFARERLVRLGVPILVYTVIVMPLLAVLIESIVGDLGTPTWWYFEHRLRALSTGPAWFIAVLLAVSLGYALWRRLVPRPIAAPVSLRTRHLVGAAGSIAMGTFVVRLVWPIDSNQILDIHLWLWPQCIVLFVLGVISAEPAGSNQSPTSSAANAGSLPEPPCSS